jgi:hypothetical protein
MESLPYISKIPCSLLQGASIALPVKIASCFGVLEYWIIGVLQKAGRTISTSDSPFITPSLHYSSRLSHEGKTSEVPSVLSVSLWLVIVDYLANSLRIEARIRSNKSKTVAYLHEIY